MSHLGNKPFDTNITRKNETFFWWFSNTVQKMDLRYEISKKCWNSCQEFITWKNSYQILYVYVLLQNGDASLHIAVALGRKRMAKKLIRLGASGHIRNNVSMLLSRLKSHYLLPSREKRGKEKRFYDYMLTMRGLTIRHGQFSMKSKFVLLWKPSNLANVVHDAK